MNILVTDFENSGEDVMIFTDKFTPGQVEQKLKDKNKSFNEIYPVPDSELQYYIYDPCWI